MRQRAHHREVGVRLSIPNRYKGHGGRQACHHHLFWDNGPRSLPQFSTFSSIVPRKVTNGRCASRETDSARSYCTGSVTHVFLQGTF